MICVFSPWVIAQQSEKSEEMDDACDIQIEPIDSRELAEDPERTKARVIARMLLDMDRCIGMQGARIASTQSGNSQGTQAGLPTGQKATSSASSDQVTSSVQANTVKDQTTKENATSNTDPTDPPNEESDGTLLSDLSRNVPTLPTSIQHNTDIFDLGSDEELVLDDYAKTLHEAYLAETDPVLKEALRKELSNYLKNKKR